MWKFAADEQPKGAFPKHPDDPGTPPPAATAPPPTIDTYTDKPKPEQGFDWGGLVDRAGKWITDNPQISSPLIGTAVGGLGSWMAGRSPLAGAAMGGIAGYGFGQLGGFGRPAQKPIDTQASMQAPKAGAAPTTVPKNPPAPPGNGQTA